jgi:hypothetical protein
MYTFETSNGVNNNRVCSVHFIGAPGTMLAFEFSSFSMATGSCHGTPAECMCLEETVTVRDGLRSDARAVGQSLCGNFEPGRFLLSGNTGRMDIVSTQASSTFTVYVTHLINKVNIKTPANPSFALGSPIQLEWFTDASVGNWAECGTGAPQMSQMHGVGKKTPQDESWNRQYSCARSPASDHGWIGIYRNGTCEDGPMVPHAETDAASVAEGVHAHAYAQGQKPHECYLGYKSIPKRHTRGTVTFEYGKDYFSSGDYSIRFFSGESAGRVCEVLPSSAETDPYEHKRLQCHYSPVSRAEVHVTANRATYSGSTEKSQLPGYERTINY